MMQKGTNPMCDNPHCNINIKTNVILYYEDLPKEYNDAEFYISSRNYCNTLLIIG